MQDEGVNFRWDEGSLVITLDDELDFQHLIEQLKEKVIKAKGFFINSNLRIELNNRKLNKEEKNQLVEIFNSLQGLSVIEIVSNSILDQKTEEVKEDSELPTLLLNRTLRSGQSITYEGNVVIKGDVNPGAEVTATGDILVMGIFRGIGHAGASGREESTIIAFRLQPLQLRIGNKISRAPDGEVNYSTDYADRPEIALIKDGAILIKELKN
ncbi:septum site-determining protein MinC [Acetohalobium arabaticum]|uniref:Probable septum site-determining protein MinC n=1 Tax=Acetohalobium arabaticum (strain ATCC 49924 / DSM 5501 / Z-7288) TaxID=574087 RepID=D9QV44_ACEAZ|nr:septum site-determining protein MinC [Acetohalobium arabaticum]ADL12103.1 septum site-determining protein MinC [Acetohalobium arabaticum DSM 5501]